MKTIVALAALCPLLLHPVFADDLSDVDHTNKWQYNLFNPTPFDLLRPLESDQYDGVFDAHTLDAGHLQIESSLINFYYYSVNRQVPGVSYREIETEYNWGPRITIGLWNNVDFEINPSYIQRAFNYGGAYVTPTTTPSFNYTVRTRNFGNIGMGPKINLFGNDSDGLAVALHPYLSIPTDHGDVLPGLDIPIGYRLPDGWYVKEDTEFFLTDNSAHTHYLGFQNSASIHKTLCSKAEAYCYLNTEVTCVPHQPWFGYTGLGLIYSITGDLQLFGGMGFGLQRRAFDYNPRLGAVVRF